MFSFKIVAVVLLATTFQTECSIVHQSPVPVASPLRYTIIAPQNVRPFAAQVSTFTKGLNIYASPYASGVIGGPAIVSRNILPAAAPIPAAGPYQPVPALAQTPALASPYLPVQGQSPYYPGSVSVAAASPYYPQQVSAFAPYPYHPGQVPTLAASPYLPAASPVAHPAAIAPAHLLPAPFARSVHPVSPVVGPAIDSHLSAAPFLG